MSDIAAERSSWTEVQYEDRRSPQADVRFGSKADMCSATRHVRFVPKADMGRLRAVRQQRGYARQNDPELGELAGLSINLYRPAMLLDDDVVADG